MSNVRKVHVDNNLCQLAANNRISRTMVIDRYSEPADMLVLMILS